MTARPNILLITSDQHRGDCFGFAGRQVRTPHLDALARAGARFDACITPNVVCQPARASMLTGLLPLSHGVWDNGVDLDADVADRGFAAVLGKAGYATGLIGKAHFSTYDTFAPTGRPECRTSSLDYGDDWYGPYMGFDHVELLIGGHNHDTPAAPPSGLHYERWYHADGRGAERNAAYGRRIGPDAGAAQTHGSGLPSALHNSTWVGDRTIEYLHAHRDAPFCLWASFPDPHNPFDCPHPWSRSHEPGEVDLPPHRTRDLGRRPWWHAASLRGAPRMEEAGQRRWRQERSRARQQSDKQLRHLIANYYGMIALVDHNVGRILLALETHGLAETTIVVFTSDHGEWLGDHGLLLKGPMHYEGLLRVGLLMRGPGVASGLHIAEPVSTLDLPATFLEIGGAGSCAELHGRSLTRLAGGEPQTRDFAYNEWNLHASRCGVGLELRTVRTRRHKLTLELASGAGELYDLFDDPHELDNRFDDPAARGVRSELTDMIASRPSNVMRPFAEPVGVG